MYSSLCLIPRHRLQPRVCRCCGGEYKPVTVNQVYCPAGSCQEYKVKKTKERYEKKRRARQLSDVATA